MSDFFKEGTVVIHGRYSCGERRSSISFRYAPENIYRSYNGLELRLDKCSFLCTEIEDTGYYLGYKISVEKMRPNNRGVTAVQNFPKPKTIKKVQSFLGLRKFIAGFSIIARPIRPAQEGR